MKNDPIEILFEDENYTAVNKPPGLLVHRSRLSEDRVFLLQWLRDQIGRRLYPVHRLDRATSGTIVFGNDPDAAARLVDQFTNRKVRKKYIAIVRGYMEEEGTIDHPLDDPETNTGLQTAVTHFKKLDQVDFPHAIGKRYPTARYSLIELEPHTGRRQQLRKHMSHLRHPILGDKRHGDVKHNTYFRDHFELERLFLHAYQLAFDHPYTGERVELRAPLDSDFRRCLELLRFSDAPC